MARKSSIKTLPKEILEQVNRLLTGDLATLDEIVATLEELGYPRSRSSLGRYKQEIEEIAADVRRSRAVAEALTERFGDKPDNQVARANIEMMHSVCMKMMTAGDGLVTLDPREAMFAATALQKLAQAEKLDADRTLTIERNTAKRAAKAIEKVAGERGLAADTVEEIKSAILGVPKT